MSARDMSHISDRTRLNSNVASTTIPDLSRILPPPRTMDSLREWHHSSFMENRSLAEKEEWLSTLLDYSPERVDAEAYHVVLEAWANASRSNPAAPHRAEHWVGRMEEHHVSLVTSSSEEDAPSLSSSSSVLSPLLLHSPVQPTVDTYNHVMRAWKNNADRRHRDVVMVRTERWLSRLRDAHGAASRSLPGVAARLLDLEDDENGNGCRALLAGPDTESYNLYLHSCASHRRDPERGAVTAEATLDRMLRDREIAVARNKDGATGRAAPNTESFNLVLKAWSRCTKHKRLGDKVTELLRRMEGHRRRRDVDGVAERSAPLLVDVAPNIVSYTIAMQAWGVVAARKATAFVRRQRYSRRNKRRRYDDDDPRTTTKTGARDPKASENGVEEAEKAEAILRYVHELHEASGEDDVAPDTGIYNCLLNVWSRVCSEENERAPLETERLLRRMIELRDGGSLPIAPDQRTYGMIIKAWARTHRVSSVKRAHWWLREMKREYEERGNKLVRPNIEAYNFVVQAFADVDDAESADLVFQEILNSDRASEDDASAASTTTSGRNVVSVSPDSNSFQLIVSAWTRYESYCSRADAGQGCRRAHERLLQMIEHEEGGRPGVTTFPEVYVNVIKATRTSTSTDLDLLEIAVDAFSRLRTSRHHADWLAHTWLLETGLRILTRTRDDDRRRRFVRRVVAQCRDDGVLAKGVVRAVSNGPVFLDGWTVEKSQELTEDVFGEWPIPKSWTRNLKDKNLIPTKADLVRKHAESVAPERSTSSQRNGRESSSSRWFEIE